MTFNLTKGMQAVGSLFVTGIRQRIKAQMGIDGRPYSPPAPSTIKARKRLFLGPVRDSKHIPQLGMTSRGTARLEEAEEAIVPQTRLYVTHDLEARGFQFEAGPDSVTVFVSDVPHIPFYYDTPALSDIIRWNSQGMDDVNVRIADPPLVFPTNEFQVRSMPEWQTAMRILRFEVMQQAEAEASAMLQRTLKRKAWAAG